MFGPISPSLISIRNRQVLRRPTFQRHYRTKKYDSRYDAVGCRKWPFTELKSL